MKNTLPGFHKVTNNLTGEERIVRRAALVAAFETLIDSRMKIAFNPPTWNACIEANSTLYTIEERNRTRAQLAAKLAAGNARIAADREAEELARERDRALITAHQTRQNDRATAIVPEGYLVLPASAITKPGDLYYSVMQKKWAPLRNSLGRRVNDCYRGRILRKNPFRDDAPPLYSDTLTDLSKLPPDYYVLPGDCTTESGDLYLSACNGGWRPLDTSLDKTVKACNRGRIIRKITPTPNTREDAAGYTHGPTLVDLFTRPAWGSVSYVSFGIVNRECQPNYRGRFLVPNGVSVVKFTDLALRLSGLSDDALTNALRVWINLKTGLSK